MKLSAVFLLLSATGWVQAQTTAIQPHEAASPLDVVNERMEAHNAHDLERFLAVYADDIQIYDFPNTPLGTPGKDHLRKIFAPLFNNQAVQTQISEQMVNGKFVVNRETVTRNGRVNEYISIYEVEGGLIRSVRFIK